MPTPWSKPRPLIVKLDLAAKAHGALESVPTSTMAAKVESVRVIGSGEDSPRLRLPDTRAIQELRSLSFRKASDLFVECLEAEGVRMVFGIPGEETLDLNESLDDSSITFVPVRHEQGGAYMADMYGRLTGRAGVCLGTLGPGATNLVTGIADAFLDRAPLVAL